MWCLSMGTAGTIQDAICAIYLYTRHVPIGSLAQRQFSDTYKQVFVPFVAMVASLQLLQIPDLRALDTHITFPIHLVWCLVNELTSNLHAEFFPKQKVLFFVPFVQVFGIHTATAIGTQMQQSINHSVSEGLCYSSAWLFLSVPLRDVCTIRYFAQIL